MSGKVYTMKEMKGIVTYLTEHQAYGEVRGRKMWVDYANSNATTRTWQSLKETFLKRILPDIHNPYYNLTREQIISFRQGYDVEQRDKNKLEIQPVGDNSNNNTENNKDNEEQVVTSSDEAMVQGENDKCSNVTSKDIPVQETCYKTIDDLRRDLESPKTEDDNKSTHSKSEENVSTVKTILKDFASNSESIQQENPKITTTENENVIELGSSEDTDKSKPDSVSAIQDNNSDDTNVKTDENKFTEKTIPMEDDGNNIGNNINDGNVTVEPDEVKVVEKDVSDDILEISSTNNKDKETTLNKKNETQESVMNLTSSVQPLTNSNSESVLPNNQEGLKIQNKNTSEVDNTSDAKNSKRKPLRKRSSSAETVLIESKRQKRGSTYDASDKNSVPAENDSEPEVYNVIDSDSEHATETKENKAETGNNTISRQSVDEATPTQNPCLESVSLFAEQFNEKKYLDTTSDENTSKKNDPKPSGSKEVKKDDDVVVLKSHSESESGEESTEIGHKISKRASHAKRKKALANVFGVYSGAVSSRQNRQSSQVRRSHKVPHPKDDQVSDSSEWTTDTEHDAYISPPRGRKHRMARKYLKPKSARVLSLEEEGGLFVMYRKRIYPLVKDGRIVKNYVIYESNSDSGFEQDTYWKAKYAELKKKYEEKKKAKEPSERSRSASHEPSSPILQPNIRKNPPPVQNYDIHAPSTSTTYPAIQNTEPVIQQPVENKTLDKITIKYIMSNAEVQLEGHWPQICPVFDKVLDRLPKKLEPVPSVDVKRASVEVTEQPNVILSGESTPIIGTNDPAIQEKIDKLESEIFKKIEEKDKEDEINNETEENTATNNVTSRKRGRPTKQSMSPETPKKLQKPSPPKKKIPTQAKNTSESVEIQSDVKQKTEVPPARTRRSMKAALDAQKESKTTDATQGTSNTPQTTTNRIQRPRSFADQIVFQDDNSLLASESTQGYLESDVSPVKLKKRRKSKRSTIAHRNKLQSKRNQRLQPYLIQDASSDSTSTSFSGSIKSKTSQSSSEIYKSDSYRHLFPRAKISFNRLEPISEKSATVNEVEMRPFDAVCRNELNTDSMDSDILINGSACVGSSSNVSLPQSPELSIVEDISIGKELLNSIKNYHNMKNTPTIDVIMDDEQDKYMISDVDVTLPLMEQKCVLQKSNTDVEMINTTQSNRKKKLSVSESLINKICTVNIRDNSTASDSLDLKLRNLLLESAKKMSKANLSKENMEIDENILHTMQKSKAKRRCSTPRKKKETVKSKLSTQTTTEEHLETCSYRARKSCPPSMQIQEENTINPNEINIDIVENVKNKPKSRKKKDIIKVKILRPSNKNVSKDDKEYRTQRASKMSICTDSGINGTESGTFPISNDTVELIHNHSETCLHANECLNNSVEFVNASTSIISVNSNSITTEWQDSRHFKDTDDMSLCSMNNNMEGACNNVGCIKTYINDNKGEKKSKTIANNEILNSSLITEDLSDEAPAQPVEPSHPSRWYLLSEDETTNTNFVSPPSNSGGFGSNLNQIFPLTCAVPNLSTITEMSKENDSRKPFGLDSFTRDSNSQNIFL